MDICDQINEISFELRIETIINIEIVSIRSSSEIFISFIAEKKNQCNANILERDLSLRLQS